MIPSRRGPAAWALLVLLLVPAAGLATTVMQMNLAGLCQRADRIFRGRVLEIRTGEAAAGGGRLPTVTYVLEVEETFKGAFAEVKGRRLAEVTMLGKVTPVQTGDLRRVASLPGLPALEMGSTYLLLTSEPGASGLSTTIGLGQGCFQVGRVAGQEVAVNGFGNLGLFEGLASLASLAPREAGPMDYDRLAAAIRAVLRDAEAGR